MSNKGKIITFYSYKGGVGRSMALANTATLLSSWGKKVLIIDWDLEAPGLENFFIPYIGPTKIDFAKQKGILELLTDLKGRKKVDWRDYVCSLSTEISACPIDLIVSGRANEDYKSLLREFNVDKFYTENSGGYIIEQLRKEWIESYDFVLVDSRTGVSDFGGICTIQMPDILVMILTPTQQGLGGTTSIASRVEQARRKLPFDREKLLIFPVPSKIDSTVEFKQSRIWMVRFAKEFQPFYDEWIPDGIKHLDFLEKIKIPYVGYFSFGEKLSVIEQGMSDPSGLGYAYENLAIILSNSLNSIEAFVKSRNSLLNSVPEVVIIKKSVPSTFLVITLLTKLSNAIKQVNFLKIFYLIISLTLIWAFSALLWNNSEPLYNFISYKTTQYLAIAGLGFLIGVILILQIIRIISPIIGPQNRYRYDDYNYRYPYNRRYDPYFENNPYTDDRPEGAGCLGSTLAIILIAGLIFLIISKTKM